MKLKIFRCVVTMLLTLWMLVIFLFSSQTASQSSALSRGFTYKVFSLFYPDFNDFDEDEQREIIASVMFPVRKAAHLSLYFVLGILSYLTFITYKSIKFHLRSIMSFGLCVLYAATDEFHQTFVSGRSGEVRDVFIDSLGALLAIFLVVVISGSIKKFRNKVM